VNPFVYPKLVFVVTFVSLSVAAWLGARLRRHELTEEDRPDFNLVVGATLTLLGLIIGFSFSMALERYDLRKNYEEAEANAIGTEYVRADLLPQADAARVRDLLRQYTDLRIRFYQNVDTEELRKTNVETAKVQAELWMAASRPAMAQPSPVIALAVGGMNDVLNSQGYTQAAWWNRISAAAWGLLLVIAIFSNALVGYGSRRVDFKLCILPLVVAVSFFLIADIDSPRRGVIRVHAQNLSSLRAGLNAQ
jgi:hypothetical protein